MGVEAGLYPLSSAAIGGDGIAGNEDRGLTSLLVSPFDVAVVGSDDPDARLTIAPCSQMNWD